MSQDRSVSKWVECLGSDFWYGQGFFHLPPHPDWFLFTHRLISSAFIWWVLGTKTTFLPLPFFTIPITIHSCEFWANWLWKARTLKVMLEWWHNNWKLKSIISVPIECTCNKLWAILWDQLLYKIFWTSDGTGLVQNRGCTHGDLWHQICFLLQWKVCKSEFR